ncbi:retrovirus-related pol polyprotein from transposon TNT 1-94 [Tanacetum coccineum]|uniref:Retrovirus-related pol polyprotein from transposon TNT 1-94 n=1 Tax=Tanacetum coccineum TaxID=301880 RepID=A0ABQ4YR12_9ASTR
MHILKVTRALRFQASLPLRFWGDYVTTATYLINRIPSSVLQNKTPYEMLLNNVPYYSNLRVFDCFVVATNPSSVVDKFVPRGIPCVFLGYPAHQKGYKLYNILTHSSFVSRDVVFHEHIFPFNESSSQNFFPMPVSMPNHTHPVVYDDFTQQDPKGFKEAVKDAGWCDAMNAELRALEENGTWELVDLPPNKKVIGTHWIFKTKLRSDGSIDRNKARLVVQGNRQMKEVYYEETFAPVAKMITVRPLLAVEDITQMDVSNAFLHGYLFEEVYMQLPMGYVGKGENVQDTKISSSKVYKLKKSLYGLKQAPRQWFSKLSSALVSFGYQQSKADYSLFTKKNAEGFIVVLVNVDDLMITEVRNAEFGLFVSQKNCTMEMLQEAGVMNSRPYKLPMDPSLKLLADSPTLAHMQAVIHLLKYLLNSPGEGILLTHHSKVYLTAYCDSD